MASVWTGFKNLGHFFATAVSKIFAAVPKVVAGADKVNAAVQAEAPTVEAVTAVVPVYGPLAVKIEQAGVMALGAIVGVIHALGDAAEAKLLDAGLDQTAIQTAQDVYSKLPSEIKAIVSSGKNPTPVGAPIPPANPAS
jgi:hypothetical protein